MFGLQGSWRACSHDLKIPLWGSHHDARLTAKAETSAADIWSQQRAGKAHSAEAPQLTTEAETPDADVQSQQRSSRVHKGLRVQLTAEAEAPAAYVQTQ